MNCVITVKTFQGPNLTARTYFGSAEALSENEAFLSFSDENGLVSFSVSPKPYMRRTGEYSLYLTFVKGIKSEAKLGIGKNEAAVLLYTEEYAYSVKPDLVRAYIKYYLDFGKERQNFKVVITARLNEPLK